MAGDGGGDPWATVVKAFGLTRRESQVLHGIWSCHKRAKIAADLKIAIPTVDTHWTAIKRKMMRGAEGGGVGGTHNQARKIVDGLLTEIRLKRAVSEAVAAATDPLHQTIASLQQQVRELEEQLEEVQKSINAPQES